MEFEYRPFGTLDDLAREETADEIVRTDDTPMTYHVAGEEGHRYELRWTLANTAEP